MESFKEQMQQSMEAFRSQQRHELEGLKDFVTGLSMEVSQFANMARGSGEGASGNHNPSFSRLSRVEFPRFWGEDVQGWIYKCEQFSKVDSMEDGLKVRVASIHLSDKALQWHQSFMRNRNGDPWPRWDEYKTAILSRFGPKPFDDPLADLMRLRQTGNVEMYQENFDSLLSRVDLTPSQAISCFLSGLTEEIQNAVRMFRPQTLHEACCLAKLQEATLQSMARKIKPWG